MPALSGASTHAKHGGHDFRASVAGIFQLGKHSEGYPYFLGNPGRGPVVGCGGLRSHNGSELGEALTKIYRIHRKPEEKKKLLNAGGNYSRASYPIGLRKKR
jgi:hypothetical protein